MTREALAARLLESVEDLCETFATREPLAAVPDEWAECSEMEKSKLSEAASAVFQVLEPFDEGERTRIVTSALALLGQSLANVQRPGAAYGLGDDHDGEAGVAGAKSRRWMTQNGITASMLEQCFHLEPETPEVVADVPGKSAREKTVNSYLLTGNRFIP